MSRMDRYKHVHEESKGSIFQRKKISKKPEQPQAEYDEEYFEAEPYQAENYQQNEQESFYQEPPQSKKYKQPKKPKKRKKHRFFRCLIAIILIFIVYSGGAFFLGQKVAKSDAGAASQAQTFNGMASQSGAHNILLVGNDSRDGETARADSIMVMQLDGPAKKPKLISFMRDTLVDIPGYGQNKINASYAFGGIELLRQTLAQNFGIDAQYYMVVDFKTFEKVIDTLFPRGVKIDAEKDMSKYIEVAIKKGPQRMDGLTLLQYSRFRMDEEGDFGRVRRQQQTMNAIFKELRNPLAILKLPYAAGKVMGYASTDLSTGFLAKNIFSIAKGASGVDRLSVPVDDSWNYGQTYEVGSYLDVDYEMNRQAIQDFLEK